MSAAIGHGSKLPRKAEQAIAAPHNQQLRIGGTRRRADGRGGWDDSRGEGHMVANLIRGLSGNPLRLSKVKSAWRH
jgi:hypothetical protein